MATGGYGPVFYLSTNAMGNNVTASIRAYMKGAYFANPCYTQIHPTCIPVSGDHQSKLTLMSESLRNDGRIWVPTKEGDPRGPAEIPEDERDYYLERMYPSFGNLAPRDIASRRGEKGLRRGARRGRYGPWASTSTSRTPSSASVCPWCSSATATSSTCTRRSPARTPIRCPCASTPPSTTPWAVFGSDYNLMSNIPGLFVLGESNFSDHGANRLGASALMQGLADGYFVAPYTVGNYLAGQTPGDYSADSSEFTQAVDDVKDRVHRVLSVDGKRTVTSFHRELGMICWDYCGMARTDQSLKKALDLIPALKEEFWENVSVPGGGGRTQSRARKGASRGRFPRVRGTHVLRRARARRNPAAGHFPGGIPDARRAKPFATMSISAT